MSSFTYFQNQTTDGTSPEYEVHDGGFVVIKATGTLVVQQSLYKSILMMMIMQPYKAINSPHKMQKTWYF